MSDPFRPESNQQLLKEARIGLTLLALTLGIFCYVAYLRISDHGSRLPSHVLEAPIAETVWPGENPALLASNLQEPQSIAGQVGGLIASARKSFGIDKEMSPAKSRSGKTSNYTDPVPRKKADPLPVVRIPVRNVPDPLGLDSLKRGAVKRKASQLLASSRQDQHEPIRMPIDINQLRSPANATIDSPTQTTPSNANTDLRQPASSMTVNVTPDQSSEFDQNTKLQENPDLIDNQQADSGFRPKSLRPLANSIVKSQVQDNSNEFAPLRSAQQTHKSPRLESGSENTGFAPNESDPHVGSMISSRVITSDIAAEFAGHIDHPEESVKGQINQIPLNENPDSKIKDSTSPKPFVDSDHSTDDAIQATDESAAAEHTVKNGESFWSIAQQNYDDGRYFRALYEYNRTRVGSFENLLPGSEIATPSKTELAKLWPELCPKPNGSFSTSTDVNERIHVTRDGDTLFGIARQRLGQASRYLEILKLNESRIPKNVNHLSQLPAGIRLVIPLEDAE